MTAALIALAMGLGFVYVRFSWARATVAPLTNLLVSLRPLLVVVFVIAASFTVNLGLPAELAVAFLLVVVVYAAVVRPELARASPVLGQWWHAIENGLLNAAKKLSGIGVAGLILAWLVVQAAESGSGILAGQGGGPAVVLVAALLVLGSALITRLVGYARTPLRSTVAVLLGIAVVLALLDAGVAWSFPTAGQIAVWVAGAAAAALVVTIVVERIGVWQPSAAAVVAGEKWLGLGLSLGVLSGVLFAVATGASLWALDHPHVKALHIDRGAHGTLYTRADASNEYRHAPVLAFTRNQKWSPVRVDDYVKRATVLRLDGSVAGSRGEYVCPSFGPAACLQLRVFCPSADKPCAKALPLHETSAPVSDGAVYVRTLRRPEPGDDTDTAVALRGIFRPVSKVAAKTNTLLQYWMFYPYDEWNTKILGAKLTQRHEGDWEAVTVGLGALDMPLFVAYSAHCGGTWELWGRTERFGSHPLVAVARGSQANYAEAGSTRPPDFTSCQRLPRGVGALLSFAANVRDVTSDDWEWGAAEVVPVNEKQWPMSFPGSWGGNDVTEFENARTRSTKSGFGPLSPPLQALWERPMTTIFCDRYWEGPQACSKA